MKSITRAIALTALLCVSGVAARADSLKLVDGGTDVMGGVYVGPYNFTGTIAGQTGSFRLVCDDFSDEVYPGESWNVNVSTFPSLSNVEFSGTKQYEEAGWLLQQMNENFGNAQTVGDIQWAIWDIFDSGVSSHDPYGSISSTNQSNINDWLSLAESNYAVGNYSNVSIFTPVKGSQKPYCDGQPQEYIGITSTPEPGTLALVAGGLLFLVTFRRRFAL